MQNKRYKLVGEIKEIFDNFEIIKPLIHDSVENKFYEFKKGKTDLANIVSLANRSEKTLKGNISKEWFPKRYKLTSIGQRA